MEALLKLLAAVAPFKWPLFAGLLLLMYRKPVALLADATVARIQGGDSLTVGMITIGQSTGRLKEPAMDEEITDDHLALIHRSWHSGSHDQRFGQKMFNIQVIIFGTEDALRSIDYVVYRLDRSYPSPVRLGGPPESNFELKELANGYSLIRADVYVRGQRNPVALSRLVDLTDTSVPLEGSAYLRQRPDSASP